MRTLGKEERLCSKIVVNQIFKEGTSFIKYPIRFAWVTTQHNPNIPVRILVTASKRNFKRAVDRNRIKRLLRESYRKNKDALFEILKRDGNQIALTIMYVGKEIVPYHQIEKKMNEAIHQLCKQLKSEGK